LGDFGFHETYSELFHSDICHDKHKILLGNHDDYKTASKMRNVLPRYGRDWKGALLFYVSGAMSPDRHIRQSEGEPWYSEEEMSFPEMFGCYTAYKDNARAPDIVIAHTAPTIMKKHMLGNHDSFMSENFGYHDGFVENTTLLLDKLIKYTAPKFFICGHFHRDFDMEVQGTRYICLNELSYIDIETNEDGELCVMDKGSYS
jgi:hypothetical protein